MPRTHWPCVRYTSEGRVLTALPPSQLPAVLQTEQGDCFAWEPGMQLLVSWQLEAKRVGSGTWTADVHYCADPVTSEAAVLVARRTKKAADGSWQSSVSLDHCVPAKDTSIFAAVVNFQNGSQQHTVISYFLIISAKPGLKASSSTSEADLFGNALLSSPQVPPPATETSIASEAALPKPSPHGDGAALLSKGKEKPVGVFARALLAGKPPLLAPTPGKDGEVFLQSEGSEARGDTAFARKLRGELSSGPIKDEDSEADGQIEGSQQMDEEEDEGDDHDEQDLSEEEEEEGRSEQSESNLRGEEQDVKPNVPAPAQPGSSQQSKDNDDEEGLQCECALCAGVSMNGAVEGGSSGTAGSQQSTESADLIRDLHAARDRAGCKIRAALDDYRQAINTCAKELNAYKADSDALDDHNNCVKGWNAVAREARTHGLKRKRTEEPDAPLTELALSPFIKRLQQEHPSRASQYADAKKRLQAEDIAGDCIMELGVEGLRKAGLTLGVAGAIVNAVRQDRESRS